MRKYQINPKRLGALVVIFFCLSFLVTAPNVFADLVTAYTFESGTELKDVAVMLGGGGVASDDLTCSGTCTLTDGVFGQGIEVGLADYFAALVSSSDLDPGPNGFTVALYTKGTEWGNVAGGHTLTKYLPSNGWDIVTGGLTTGYEPMTIVGTLSDSGSYYRLRVPDETVEGAWRHIAMTYDGINTAKLYIDGVLRVERNDVAFTPANVGVYGSVASHAPSQADHAYGGFFDDIAIFNEPLSAGDIQRLSEEGIEAFMGYTPEPSPLAQNLIGYWKFDGNGADSSGKGRDLDLYGGVGFATGLFGQALDLPDWDSDHYAQRYTDDNSYDFGTGDFTIQVWVNFYNLNWEQVLIEKLKGPSGPGWSLTSGGGTWHFYSGEPSNPAAVIFSPIQTVPLGEWHQIVLRRNSSEFELFYNGASIASLTSAMPIPDTFYPLLVGKRNELDDRGFALNGKLDEIAIWNRALSNDEIELLWNGGSGTEIPPAPTPDVSGYIEVKGTPLEGATVTIKQHQKPQTTETINGHFQLESVNTAQGCTITIRVPETP
jgi:hypothetical protein